MNMKVKNNTNKMPLLHSPSLARRRGPSLSYAGRLRSVVSVGFPVLLPTPNPGPYNPSNLSSTELSRDLLPSGTGQRFHENS